MQFKIKKFAFAAIIVLLTLCGCSGQTGSGKKPEGFDKLEGLWTVSGIYYKNSLIDVNDVRGIADLYDNVMLTFAEDGTFLYSNMYNSRGEYIKYNDDGSGNETFLLKTNYVFTYDMEGTSLVEKEWENATKNTYIITLLDDALKLEEFDAISGTAKSDDIPLILTKDSSSQYVENNKAEIKTDQSSPQKQETEPTPKPTAKPTPKPTQKPQNKQPTSGEKNALRAAENYLSFMPFSYSGLIDQLEFEGYTYSEAKYAADNCGADWYEQAVVAAQSYLNLMSFSYGELIDQLGFEGYTYEQAVYAVDAVY